MSLSTLIGEGTTVSITVGDVTTDIAALKSASFPSPTDPAIDNTNMSSTARTNVIGMEDEGSCSFTAEYDYNTYVTLHGYAISRKSVVVTMMTPVPDLHTESEGVWSGSGFITSIGPASVGVDGIVTYSVTIKFDGTALQYAADSGKWSPTSSGEW